MSVKKYDVYNLDEYGRNHSAEYFDKNFTLHGCINLVKIPVFLRQAHTPKSLQGTC